MLKHASNRLEISTLTKQLHLANNLFDHHFHDLPVEDWEKLFSVLQLHEATLKNGILNENGPKKKQNAENALNVLLSTMEDYFRQNMRVAA
jgi:hypothetical protein